jgi:hypothetical protein
MLYCLAKSNNPLATSSPLAKITAYSRASSPGLVSSCTFMPGAFPGTGVFDTGKYWGLMLFAVAKTTPPANAQIAAKQSLILTIEPLFD